MSAYLASGLYNIFYFENLLMPNQPNHATMLAKNKF